MTTFSIADCPLGKKVPYPICYDPSLLFAIPRQWSREKTFAEDIAQGFTLGEFCGVDIWNDYEFSFIDATSGLREICFLQVIIPSTSEFLIESKSFKLYLFSFAQEQLSTTEIIRRIESDGARITKTPVSARLYPLSAARYHPRTAPHRYQVLDNLSSCASYHLDSSLLARSSQAGEITQAYLFKNFRSLCLVSGKPDWAEIRIDLRGPGVCPEALYRYLVSFRNHQGIHEQCIERIFFDLQQLLSPAELSVAGLFTRRGGLDINPIRSTKKLSALMDMSTQWQRTSRQ